MTPSDLNNEFRSDSQKVMFHGFHAMIGTALVFALLSIITIAQGIWAKPNGMDYLIRLPYWLVSVLAVCMVYTKVHTYGRFITHRMTIWDVSIPFTKALVGSALFAVLNGDDKRMWHLWPLIFAIFALISHFKIRYYMSRLDEAGSPPETAHILRTIKYQTLRGDLRATGGCAAGFFTIWMILNFGPSIGHWSNNWEAVLAVPAAFAIAMAIHSDTVIRREIVQLSEAHKSSRPLSLKLSAGSGPS